MSIHRNNKGGRCYRRGGVVPVEEVIEEVVEEIVIEQPVEEIVEEVVEEELVEDELLHEHEDGLVHSHEGGDEPHDHEENLDEEVEDNSVSDRPDSGSGSDSGVWGT
jgi:hypothetical protein